MTPQPFSFESVEDIVNGGIMLIDKPYEWTSFDVVGKLKWFLRRYGKAPKFKIGHAGTLDPLATGLLVICTGRCTKMIDAIMSGEKEYTGTIFLGKTTPSFDLETQPEGDYSIEHVDEAALVRVAASFLGEQMQTPPVYSAKQIDGKRAYEAARAGIEVKMRQALVTVHAFEITRVKLPEVDFRIRCSKGTYIRTIAHEFGQRLNSGSYLKALRRTESAPFRVEDAVTVDEMLDRLRGMTNTPKP